MRAFRHSGSDEKTPWSCIMGCAWPILNLCCFDFDHFLCLSQPPPTYRNIRGITSKQSSPTDTNILNYSINTDLIKDKAHSDKTFLDNTASCDWMPACSLNEVKGHHNSGLNITEGKLIPEISSTRWQQANNTGEGEILKIVQHRRLYGDISVSSREGAARLWWESKNTSAQTFWLPHPFFFFQPSLVSVYFIFWFSFLSLS